MEKKIQFRALFLMLIILFGVKISAQTSTPPSGGGTSSSDPYIIASIGNLYWITQNTVSWGGYFTQTIDLDATGSSAWDSNLGFTPIGNSTTQFTGTYDGGGFWISNITINRPSSTDYVGVFGSINESTLKRVLGNFDN